MAKSDRLLRLMQLFRRLPAPVTAARLAEDLGVSMRTLYRDIDALRAAGARIDGEAGLGYTMAEDVALPPQTLTRLEVEALSVGLAEVQYRGDPALAHAAADARAKITASLHETQQRDVLHAVSQVHRFTEHAAASIDISLIREACWDEREIDIRYRDKHGAITQRRVQPLSVLYFEWAVMLLAFCTLRQDYRSFHVTNIESAAATNTSFRPRRVPLLNAYVAQLQSRLSQSGDALKRY